MYRHEPSALLQFCLYVFPHVKPPLQPSKSCSSVASNIWNSLPNHLSSIPALPVFRRALKHHLFLLAYPDSGAKSGVIKPAHSISLRDIPQTTAIAQPGNTMPPIWRRSIWVPTISLSDSFIPHRATWRMCKSCVTYLLTYLLMIWFSVKYTLYS